MKNPKYLFLFLFLNFPCFLFASQPKLKITFPEPVYQTDSVQTKKYPYNFEINFFTGIYQNSTFGTHPVLGFRLGKKQHKSFYNLAVEFRPGKTPTSYNYFYNQQLLSTTAFNGIYAGLEYDRLIFSKNKHQVNLISGLGYNGIKIPQNENSFYRLSGFAVNLGLGYLLQIKNFSGPNIQVMYHFAPIKNENGTTPDKNSILFRLSYSLAYFE